MSSTQFGWFNGCSVICPTEGTSLGFPGPILDSYSPPLQNSDTYVLHLPSRYSKTRGMKFDYVPWKSKMKTNYLVLSSYKLYSSIFKHIFIATRHIDLYEGIHR